MWETLRARKRPRALDDRPCRNGLHGLTPIHPYSLSLSLQSELTVAMPMSNVAHHPSILYAPHTMYIYIYIYIYIYMCICIYIEREREQRGHQLTLKTFSRVTIPKPAHVDCKLLRACLMSPSAVKSTASRPSSV